MEGVGDAELDRGEEWPDILEAKEWYLEDGRVMLLLRSLQRLKVRKDSEMVLQMTIREKIALYEGLLLCSGLVGSCLYEGLMSEATTCRSSVVINELNQGTATQSDELSKCLFCRFYTFLSLLETTIALQMRLCIHTFPSNMISTIRIYELN